MDVSSACGVTGYATQPEQMMTCPEAICHCLRKHVQFDGRARRSEYWWIMVFQGSVNYGIVFVTWGLGFSEFATNVLSGMFVLAMTLPGVSVAVRRLHDVNRSGWWVLIPVTIVGLIPYLYWICMEGVREPNGYGPPM